MKSVSVHHSPTRYLSSDLTQTAILAHSNLPSPRSIESTQISPKNEGNLRSIGWGIDNPVLRMKPQRAVLPEMPHKKYFDHDEPQQRFLKTGGVFSAKVNKKLQVHLEAFQDTSIRQLRDIIKHRVKEQNQKLRFQFHNKKASIQGNNLRQSQQSPIMTQYSDAFQNTPIFQVSFDGARQAHQVIEEVPNESLQELETIVKQTQRCPKFQRLTDKFHTKHRSIDLGVSKFANTSRSFKQNSTTDNSRSTISNKYSPLNSKSTLLPSVNKKINPIIDIQPHQIKLPNQNKKFANRFQQKFISSSIVQSPIIHSKQQLFPDEDDDQKMVLYISK